MMNKVTFKAVVEEIIKGYEDPGFQQRFRVAKEHGDVSEMMALPLGIQARAFEKYGYGGVDVKATFREAGQAYGGDPDIAPLVARLKAALAGL
jgi:hypothetical protein